MSSNLQISKELRRKIDNELQPGESIRWVGQPIPRFFTADSIGCVLFGIPWTIFTIFWMWAALEFKLPNLREDLQPQHLFALFGIPFMLTGFGMLSSPLLVWQAAKKSVYLVTNKRAISIQSGWSTTIRSYLPDQLKDVYRKERADGTGDVIIAIREWIDNDGDPRSEEIGFLEVRDPREVENILRQLFQNNA
ncbi:hypothetical protein H6F75_05330 [Nodosilinea sp. FACHB-131]|uniref:hypothetical protein n=1 Tax=Cyanophyceae TaxID=3028117 RepID=UPI001685CB54|nr:hypothetical protein [Nodosilinea sp. FACHB-131]MBD1872895.1 hypothetical protein [Nodosilinea sp. FACHB-131]